jgi:hypothetical protein
MQTHLSEAGDAEESLLARFERGSWVQKMLFKVDSTFDDGERGTVSGYIFQGTPSGRAPCQRDKLRTFID